MCDSVTYHSLDASLAESVHVPSEGSRNQTKNALQNKKQINSKLSVEGEEKKMYEWEHVRTQTRRYEKGQEETDSQSSATGHDA